jgi:hypothetical protein
MLPVPARVNLCVGSQRHHVLDVRRLLSYYYAVIVKCKQH